MSATLAVLACLWTAVVPAVQTQDLGQGVFYNGEGAIVMAVDSVIADMKLDKPYLMFMVYLGTSGNESVKITPDDVTMVYQGQEYKMATVKELNANYRGQRNDWELYLRAGKESLVLSKMRYWRYQTDTDFYPLVDLNVLGVREGSIAGNLGFKTRFYFKNPGFKKGDEIVIRVKDHANPELAGSCAVKFE